MRISVRVKEISFVTAPEKAACQCSSGCVKGDAMAVQVIKMIIIVQKYGKVVFVPGDTAALAVIEDFREQPVEKIVSKIGGFGDAVSGKQSQPAVKKGMGHGQFLMEICEAPVTESCRPVIILDHVPDNIAGGKTCIIQPFSVRWREIPFRYINFIRLNPGFGQTFQKMMENIRVPGQRYSLGIILGFHWRAEALNALSSATTG